MHDKKQQVKSCLFFPIQKRSKKQKSNNRNNKNNKNNKMIHIAKKLDFYTENEVKVAEFLKTNTSNYADYCHTFSSFELLGVSALNDKYLERSERLQGSHGFALFRYSPTNTILFFDHLYKCTEPRNFLYDFINGYKGFLNCIHFFNSNNIKFINWSPQNMLYNPDNLTHLVKDLSLSLTSSIVSKEEKVIQFAKFDPAAYFWPIEFHVISYIIANKETSISAFKIDSIITAYINAHPHIKKFSSKFAESYYKECTTVLTPFINKPAAHIVDAILRTMSKTWDHFILSSILINIIFGLKTVCKKGTGWIDRVLKLLLINTYPHFEKRKGITETLSLFDAICCNDAAMDDLKIMMASLNADSLIQVNQYLLESNRIIIEAFEKRKLMSAGLATVGSSLLTFV